MGLSLLLIGIFLFLGLYYIDKGIIFNNFYSILVLTLLVLIGFMIILFKLFGVSNLEEQEEL